jgi:hypothetical protein
MNNLRQYLHSTLVRKLLLNMTHYTTLYFCSCIRSGLQQFKIHHIQNTNGNPIKRIVSYSIKWSSDSSQMKFFSRGQLMLQLTSALDNRRCSSFVKQVLLWSLIVSKWRMQAPSSASSANASQSSSNLSEPSSMERSSGAMLRI